MFDPLKTFDLSFHQARAVVAAALTHAEELGVSISVSVVDSGAHLKAFARMDGASLGSPDIATGRARVARLFDGPSGEISRQAIQGFPATGGHIALGDGGIPLRAAMGTPIGAVGVAGCSEEVNRAVAMIAAEGLGYAAEVG